MMSFPMQTQFCYVEEVAGFKKSSQNCWTVYSWMTSYMHGVCKWSNFENGQLYNFDKDSRVKIAECISTRL